MKRLIYLILCIIGLASCQQETIAPTTGKAVLELDLLRAGRPVVSTRSVDDGLEVKIYKQNDAGEFVEYNYEKHLDGTKTDYVIVLEPGTFKVTAYSPNQDSWKTENDGKGAGCYYAETTVEMEYDAVTRLTLDVPMTNYAVGLELPELFDVLFNPDSTPFPNSYTFTLKSGDRTVTIKEGEKAYFDVADGGFSYALKATNNDDKTSQHSAIEYTDIAAGKLFTVKYNYSTDSQTGGVVIVITDDMEDDDNDVHL